MPSEEEEIIIADLKKQMQLMSTQLQTLKEEKEKYFLQLAQYGARLPRHFNVKDVIAPKKETETFEMKSDLKTVKDQMPNNKCFKTDETSEEEKLMLADMKKQMQVVQTQLQQLKEEEERASNKFSFRDYFLPMMLSPSQLKPICKHPRNLKIFLKKNLWNQNQSVIPPLREDLMNQLWKNFLKGNSLCYLRSLWREFPL